VLLLVAVLATWGERLGDHSKVKRYHRNAAKAAVPKGTEIRKSCSCVSGSNQRKKLKPMNPMPARTRQAVSNQRGNGDRMGQAIARLGGAQERELRGAASAEPRAQHAPDQEGGDKGDNQAVAAWAATVEIDEATTAQRQRLSFDALYDRVRAFLERTMAPS
jgi:hypothetical protein